MYHWIPPCVQGRGGDNIYWYSLTIANIYWEQTAVVTVMSKSHSGQFYRTCQPTKWKTTEKYIANSRTDNAQKKCFITETLLYKFGIVALPVYVEVSMETNKQHYFQSNTTFKATLMYKILFKFFNTIKISNLLFNFFSFCNLNNLYASVFW